MEIVTTSREQSRPCQVHVRGTNRLLTMMQDAGDGDALSKMEKVSLKQKDVLFHQNERITHVYFPLSAVASFVLEMQEGPSIEVGTVGNEGIVGTSLLMGVDHSPIEAFVQIAGQSMIMTTEAFVREANKNGPFAKITKLGAQGFFAQVAQSVGCGQAHPLEQRLARWILMSQDRVGGDTVNLTQEFLGLMLGVLRPTVTLAATTLQHAGLIRYQRGTIDVINRRGLEENACECYEKVRKEYERLLC
jgi:CRP-like cAMP-binding protein